MQSCRRRAPMQSCRRSTTSCRVAESAALLNQAERNSNGPNAAIPKWSAGNWTMADAELLEEHADAGQPRAQTDAE
jgi:hypothetical protein